MNLSSLCTAINNKNENYGKFLRVRIDLESAQPQRKTLFPIYNSVKNNITELISSYEKTEISVKAEISVTIK